MEEEQVNNPPANPPGRGASLISAAFWLRDLAVSVLFAVILIVFIYQPVKVEGTSMMPTLTDQERIFINKFTYHFGLGNIERGDMVVFWFPLDPQKSYIKRIIGVPGDMVRIDAGQVYVNEHPLAEDAASMTQMSDEYRRTMKAEFAIVADGSAKWSAAPGWPAGAEPSPAIRARGQQAIPAKDRPLSS